MKLYKVISIIIFFSFMFIPAWSQSSDELITSFIKADINTKTELINTVTTEQTELWKVAFDFVSANYALLSNDADFIRLTRTLIQKSSANNLTELLPYLKDIFNRVDNQAILLDLLTVFSAVETENTEIVTLVNNYTQGLLDAENDSDFNMLFLAIEALGNFADISSFPILFDAYVYSNNNEISQIAQTALENLVGGYENQIREVIDTGNSREKYYTLQLVLNNTENSDFFKAEMSEKALSNSIIKTETVSSMDTYTVQLQMAAIRELHRISWTRSADLITDFFVIAKDEYAAGVLTEEQFSEVITAFTSLSSGSAGEYLSEYLSTINKLKEENSPYSEAIALSVIKSLGLLGDKIAFDTLLYTTYLDYPEDIILAARDALVSLKW